MKRFIKRAYILITISATFVATVAPAIIRAADLAPQAKGASIPGETMLSDANGALVPVLHLRVTAYSSTADQTDSTPFITANGTHVHDGIVATNLLPFGTQVKIPTLFGNKIFTVEDRMSKRMKDSIDIWMATRTAALRFGANKADVVIVTDEAISKK